MKFPDLPIFQSHHSAQASGSKRNFKPVRALGNVKARTSLPCPAVTWLETFGTHLHCWLE
jgi:hypothetical protein